MIGALKLVTAATDKPVSLAEARQYLKIDSDQTAEDALIDALIATATETCRQFTGRELVNQTWRLFLDDFPGSTGGPWWDGVREGALTEIPSARRWIELPRPPLVSVTHVKTYDDADVGTIFAATNYFVDTARVPARVVLRSTASWPVVDRVANGIEVEFVAGHGTNAESVPGPLRRGILLLVAELFEQRQETVTGTIVASVPHNVAALWRPFRIVTL